MATFFSFFTFSLMSPPSTTQFQILFLLLSYFTNYTLKAVPTPNGPFLWDRGSNNKYNYSYKKNNNNKTEQYKRNTAANFFSLLISKFNQSLNFKACKHMALPIMEHTIKTILAGKKVLCAT